jgi:hypothetical protein
MYLNELDNLFNDVINNLYTYLENQKFFEKINDYNFVKYNERIIQIIKDFMKKVNLENINKTIKSKNNLDFISQLIKKYICYYIYLGLSYYYESDRDLFITNLLETSRNHKNNEYQINDFFNSYTNNKVINYYDIIKNVKDLNKYESIDRIKIILKNNPIKYDTTIKFLNDIGEDYFEKNIFIKNNFHNIIKTILFKLIYILEDKNVLLDLLNKEEENNSKYTYINIVKAAKNSTLDINLIEDSLSFVKTSRFLINDVYDFLKNNVNIIDLSQKDILNNLFNNEYFIPISEEFIRYHKNTYKYGSIDDPRIKMKESTKIKFVIDLVNKVKNYYSKSYNINPKLKLDVENLFFKQLGNRHSILYNDNEEIKIIQKLDFSDKTSDLELLIDLVNIRNYSYINYKNLSKDGFKLRLKHAKKSIRYINFSKDGPQKLEFRVGNDSNILNTVGIVFNPSGKKLELSHIKKFVNIKDLNKNGFDKFMELLQNKFENDSKIYYWLFNVEEDIIKLESYKNLSTLDVNEYIKTMMEEIYNKYEKINFEKYKKLLLLKPSLETFNKLRLNLSKKYSDKLYSIFISNLTDSKLTLRPIKKDKKLPKVKVEEIKENIVDLTKIEKEVVEESNAICYHYIKWADLDKIKKNNYDDKSQFIFDFIKKYLDIDQNNNYLCVSCGQELDIKKYVYYGTFIKENDLLLTTSTLYSEKLVNIPKYANFGRAVKNIEKILDKISFLLGIKYYLGNNREIKIRKKNLVKDVLDLVMLHTEYLQETSDTRAADNEKKYNIKKDFTNLFFFDLKDDIFTQSSLDTDYYKKIKYNNIVTYIIFFILISLNEGILLTLKENKRCNFYIFEKVKDILFGDLFLKLKNSNEKILISKIPLLCYVIFMLSCCIINNNIWLWEKDEKNKLAEINNQKIVINTLVDLINSLMDANIKNENNYLYDITSSKFIFILTKTFNDNNLYDKIYKENTKKIVIDNNTKKITFQTKKINLYPIPIKSDKEYKNYIENYCETETLKLGLREIEFEIEEDKSKIKELKLKRLRLLANKYCLNGKKHNIDLSTNICDLCKINISTKTYTEKELYLLEKNIKDRGEKLYLKRLEKKEQKMKKRETNREKLEKVITKIKSNYKKYTDGIFSNYIIDFVSFLKSYVGNKVIINKKEIMLDFSYYEINHNYLGIKKKEVDRININSGDFKVIYNHTFFKLDVINYFTKNRNVNIFYNLNSLQYLGYTDNNKIFKRIKSVETLKVNYSIKDMILLLGYKSQYLKNSNVKDDKKLIKSLLEDRLNNVRQIVLRTISIIEKVRNNDNIKCTYKSNENTLVNDFSKVLKRFEIERNDKHIFSSHHKIINNLPFEKIKDIKFDNINNINAFDMNKLNNKDCLLLFYLFERIKILIEINDDKIIKSNLCNLVLNIINLFFNQYYESMQNLNIRRFEEFLLDKGNISMDFSKNSGNYYQDIIFDEELNEEQVIQKKEDIYTNEEEQNALDVDDYEEDDAYEDYDPSDEFMDFISE